MDPVYAHLFLTHVPVIGGMGALLLLGWGLLRRSLDVTIAALAAFVIVGILGLAAFITGNVAVSHVERTAPSTLIEQHRDAAIAAVVGLTAAAVVSACAIFVWKTTRRYPMFAAMATLILGLAASILMVRAATLGGQIGHTELRAGTLAKK